MLKRQALFVTAYLETGNATQAAIAAGYSPASAYNQGSRMMRNYGVAKAIEQAKHDLANKTTITVEKVIGDLSTLAFAAEHAASTQNNESGKNDESTAQASDTPGLPELFELVKKIAPSSVYTPKEAEMGYVHVAVSEHNGQIYSPPQIQMFHPNVWKSSIRKQTGFVGEVIWDPDAYLREKVKSQC
jgi:hypothetical protein